MEDLLIFIIVEGKMYNNKPTIIVRICGGLGNQMLQIAFIEYLKSYYSNVYADLREYDGISYHNGYEIEKVFLYRTLRARQRDLIRCSRYIQLPHKSKVGLFINSGLNQMMEKCPNVWRERHLKESEFDDFSINYISQRLAKHPYYYLDGYWLHYDIISKLNLDRLFEFQRNIKELTEDMVKEIKTRCSCSVHIRKGDYRNTSREICDQHYYYRAMKVVETLQPDITFFVFSDEIEVAKQMIRSRHNTIFMDTPYKEKNSGIDMYLMSCCNHNIIANSTFSYWAAKLNNNPDKIVVAPEMWNSDVSASFFKDEGWRIIKT